MHNGKGLASPRRIHTIADYCRRHGPVSVVAPKNSSAVAMELETSTTFFATLQERVNYKPEWEHDGAGTWRNEKRFDPLESC